MVTSVANEAIKRGVGVLGGTFDPIHNGHLRLGWEAKLQLNLDQIRFIPCHIPPHRDTPHGESGHRLAMTRLACEPVPGFVVDDWEINRAAPSYTVDTLSHLRKQVGEKLPIVFLMGMDAFCQFSHWHEWENILNLAHLWVAHRPGSNTPSKDSDEFELLQALHVESPNLLMDEPAGLLHVYNTTALDISSTQLRDDIERGQDPRFLLPDSVWRYIGENNLYNVGKSRSPNQEK
ncbi:MAG: nicotinate-nucleotide adenylyltransferase [Pseudomonadales bacterium]|nr:nicotinate-nucleotide adenylyltransferase [Pseudomonadales bacterium]